MTLDRSKAQTVLLTLMIATTIACLPIAELWSGKSPDVMVIRNLGVLGVLLAITAAIAVYERAQSSHSYSKTKRMASLATGIGAVSVCGTAIAMHWSGNVGVALVFATGVVLAVPLINRLAISMWGAIAIAAIAVTLGLSSSGFALVPPV